MKIFISHATKDKELIALPLYSQLKKYNLNPWIDKENIKQSDSLFRAINVGLANSSYAVAVISTSFIKSEWTNRELESIFNLMIDKKIIRLFVVYHEIQKEDISQKYPLLSDNLSFNSKDGIEHIVQKIVNIIMTDNNIENHMNSRYSLNNISEKILEKYVTKMINNFENPLKSPYDLDKKDFIEDIDYDYKFIGNNDLLDTNSKKNLIQIIEDYLFLRKFPIVTLGNYGMGKSTIAKYLSIVAIENKILPIFIELRNLDIELINTDTIDKFIQSVIDIAFKNFTLNDNTKKVIIEFFNKKEIIIVLDGVDESIIQNNKILNKFIEFIISSELPIYISCRLEYTNFISLYNSKIGHGNFENNEHLNITLKNWSTKQWKSYENKILAQEKFKNSYDDIQEFFKDIQIGKFGDIPQRPLFLKMLVKLKIEKDILNRSGNIHYTLNETLSSNRAEIYYKYIRWQLFNDLFKHQSNEYIDKDGNLNAKTNKIINALIELLSIIATDMYRKNFTDGVTSITIEEIIDNLLIKLDKNTKYLTKEFIEDALDETSLFAILQRDNEGISFIFSHKSFMEYLVSYRLAKSIFTNNPKCDEAWGYYQTHEVSHHFMLEVQRVTISKWLKKNSNDKNLEFNKLELKTKEYRDNFLTKAFTDVLIDSLYKKRIDIQFYNYLDFDSEKFEEALFYIGRFKLKNNQKGLLILQNIFDDMKSNGDNYHPVYYRTVSLALAQIKGMSYCNEYVKFMLKDYETTFQKHYKTNLDIQKNYYGEDSVMLDKLLSYINQFLKTDTIQRDIISNDILTYFAFEKNDQAKKKYIKRIIDKAEKLKEPTLKEIYNSIQKNFVQS